MRLPQQRLTGITICKSTQPGEISWTRDVTSSGGEQNVQSDWDETNAADDAFILNKPGAATTTTIGLMSAADRDKEA